jgi:hypothetical protein
MIEASSRRQSHAQSRAKIKVNDEFVVMGYGRRMSSSRSMDACRRRTDTQKQSEKDVQVYIQIPTVRETLNGLLDRKGKQQRNNVLGP